MSCRNQWRSANPKSEAPLPMRGGDVTSQYYKYLWRVDITQATCKHCAQVMPVNVLILVLSIDKTNKLINCTFFSVYFGLAERHRLTGYSIITPVFSVTWSSEIILICWFAAQETFLIIINVENSCAAQYFCGNCVNSPESESKNWRSFHLTLY